MGKNIILIFLSAFIANTANAQVDHETGFLDRSLDVDGVIHKYQIYLPRDYDEEREWPVILFLHGGGERGDNGMAQTHVGLGRAIRFNPERWPAIVVFPQAPEGEFWIGDTAEIAMAALNQTINNYSIDESRVYLTGLSLGGGGTWYMSYQYTERFAAIVPVCAYVEVGDRKIIEFQEDQDAFSQLAEDIAGIPVWLVHGEVDQVISVEQSRRMAAALRAADANVTYTELPGVNHNSWDAAYTNEALIEWLFSQRR